MPIDMISSKKLFVVIVILIMSILMIVVLPSVVPGMLEEMDGSEKIRNEQLYAEFEPQETQSITTTRTMSWSYPLWTAITMLSGFAVIFTVKQYYNGNNWARALILVCFAVPSITGAYMIATYYHFLGFSAGFSPGFYYIIVGFIGYFTVLFLNVKGLKQKLLYFWAFSLLGVLAAYVWANGITCHVIIDSDPAVPLYTKEVFMLYITRTINWLAVIFILMAIYFISSKNKIGWYFAVIIAANTSLIGFVMQTVRTDTHDYLYQGLLALVLLITLLFPPVKKIFFDMDKETIINDQRI